ncbi:hypothetical protein PoB_001506700 [Plakobranchus ocellatus]|uniref:Uncharacterized protein n=1 Tax=Plakobranchus ocellatus TaxID=259542 RepID=A0AAV3Z036_9GAST|nr:hypothetical protein PoB_001506700 [Plakobranchus ocellatus]
MEHPQLFLVPRNSATLSGVDAGKLGSGVSLYKYAPVSCPAILHSVPSDSSCLQTAGHRRPTTRHVGETPRLWREPGSKHMIQ